MRYGSIVAFAMIALASCRSYVPSAEDSGKLLFLEPVEEWRDGRGNCRADQICWSDLDYAGVTKLLTQTQSRGAVFQRTDEGTLAYLGASARVKNGRYRLERSFMSYRNEPCVKDDPSRGIKRVGVGVRVIADVDIGLRKVRLGELLPLGAAAEKNRVRGELSIRSWGIDTRNPTLAAMIANGDVPLTKEGVEKAAQALAVSARLIDDPSAELTPATFALVETSPGSCRGNG